MWHAGRRIFLATMLAGSALLVSHTEAMAAPAVIAAPAAPAPAPAPVGAAAAAGADGTGELSLQGTASDSDARAAAAAAAICLFTTNGDYVHVSSSAFEASGHGWWVNGNCRATTAVVTVQLQEYYNDGSWRNKGVVGRSTVRSGGGAGNRATGRAGCNNNTLVGWRSVIDVDLVGQADSPDKLTTPSRNIRCLRL